LAAKAYQERLKVERQAEERRMEDEFKFKLSQKFAEDERLEQMNAQKRRMRELEHKREIERLWQEKLAIYRAQRDIELEERRAKEEDDRRKAIVVEMEKERLIREHGHVLQQYHPKAATGYGTTGFK
jgi:hypothetical protein